MTFSQEHNLNLSDQSSSAMTSKIAKVLVDSTQQAAKDSLFSYLIPNNLVDEITVGDLVSLPFGNMLCRGFILEILESDLQERDYILKEIESILHKKLFSEDYLHLLLKVSDFYLSDFLTTFKGVLPIGLLSSFQERVHLLHTHFNNLNLSPIETQIVQLLFNSKEHNLSLRFLKQKTGSTSFTKALQRLENKKVIEKNVTLVNSVKSKKNKSISLSNLVLKELNAEQQNIYLILEQAILKKQHKEFLIHGVTGSGKTEIYFKAAKQVLEQNQQVIFLVPEISLSVQLLERIKTYFPAEQITLWHSNLSDGERLKAWQECLQEGPRIVVGARSAIFAPVNNLGLIIIDEEHDSSYKSASRPFYDARIIASFRAEASQSVLIKGSATPNIVSYEAALNQKTLLQLNHRFAGQELPSVEIVDLRRELHDGNHSIFSRKLRKELEACILRKEQAILLLNRRGHSNYVFCRDCGYAVFCDHCSVPMIYHSTTHLLRCHHCNDSKPLPKACPKCASPRIKQTGLGTQRLEQEVKKNFPQAEVIRLDRDISSTRTGTQDIWNQLTSEADQNKSQILVGTQLVAKGLDLPRVTLVGVLQAEGGLYSPDYNANERSFQLLTQAAGRAGRHEKLGKVVFQTYVPEHTVIQMAAQQDYRAFFDFEIEKRQENNYPPFVKLARIVFLHSEAHLPELESVQVSKLISKDFPQIQLLGPAPCPIEKINNLYRWHILLKLHKLDVLKQIKDTILASGKLRSRLNIDTMPVSLM